MFLRRIYCSPPAHEGLERVGCDRRNQGRAAQMTLVPPPPETNAPQTTAERSPCSLLLTCGFSTSLAGWPYVAGMIAPIKVWRITKLLCITKPTGWFANN